MPRRFVLLSASQRVFFLIVLIGVFCAASLLLYATRLPPTQHDWIITDQLSWKKNAYSYHHPTADDRLMAAGRRCDTAFPDILRGRTLQLASVPRTHRIHVGTTNVTDYFLTSHTQTIGAAPREYLFDYNPSIIRLPPAVQQTLGWLDPSDTAAGPTKTTAAYLASFRVSNLNYCFRPEDRQRMINYTTKVRPKDLLGLALLTADLDLVADVVVDLAAVVRGAQDFRLFALDTTSTTNAATTTTTSQVYIGTNDVLVPLWLSASTATDAATGAAALTQIPPIFGNAFAAWIHPRPLCAPCGKPRQCGKNFHFFTSGQNQLWAEIWPTAPHLVRSVDASCRRQRQANQTFATEEAPTPSFMNREVLLLGAAADDRQTLVRRRNGQAPPWLTRGRGSACCLSIPHPTTGESLYMGISHSKTLGNHGLQPNHYLSSLYAFRSEPPFALVAQSGFFCLGFPSRTTHTSDDEDTDPAAGTMVNLTRWRILNMGPSLVYPTCPRIHFVSGLTQHASNPNVVIISYGINDCVSRFVHVRLGDLVDLLFRGETGRRSP